MMTDAKKIAVLGGLADLTYRVATGQPAHLIAGSLQAVMSCLGLELVGVNENSGVVGRRFLGKEPLR